MFRKKRKALSLILNVFIFTAITTLLVFHPSPTEAQQGSGPIYGSQSPFNQLIPSNATYVAENRIGTFRHNWEEWSMPIYRVGPDENPPLVTVINNYSGRTEHWPIPTYAIPASADDHHLGVMLPHNNIIYEFWDAQWENSSTIRAGGMTSFPLDGAGISDPPNHRVVAAGFAVSGGMVIREDFINPATGELDTSMMLNHALSMSLPFDLVASGDYVPPAVGGETNGRAGSEGIPMGARFAVPTDLDIDSLNVHPFAKELLRAARDYGIYVNDTNGAPQYNGKFVGSIRVEPGLLDELYGTDGDDLVSTIQSQVFSVVQQHGIYRVTTDGTPPTPTTPPPTTTTPSPTTTTPSPTTTTPTPTTTTPTATATEPPAANATNVILFIGDGMGFEHVEAAGYYANGEEGLFNFEQFPYVGEMTTHMATDNWTDSAASATAMATGIKVDDGVVSVAIPGNGADLQTIIEYLNMQDVSTGMITTGNASTATTAAFAAHNQSRDNYGPIVSDILQTRPTLFFSGDNDWMTPQSASGAGYTVLDSRSELLSFNTETANYVSGQFGSWSFPYIYDGYPNDLPRLHEMTTTALNILDNNPNGFFIIIEENHIDDAAHDNDLQRNVNETVELSYAVQSALDWAEGRGDTLILVTADHETGGLNVLQNNGQGNYPTVEWERTSHSSRHVPVYAWGAGADSIDGVIDNTDIYRLSRGWDPAFVGGVAITPTDLNVAQSGGTATYSVVLRSQPTDTVDITFELEGQVSINRNQLRFTTSNWNVPQTVTVTANGDGVISHNTDSDDITYEHIYLVDDVNVTVGAGIVDTDGDGLSDDDETNVYNTNPNNPDTDGDNLSDGDEVLVFTTNPLETDTDSDLLDDGDEVNVYSTDPLVFDNRRIAGYTWLDANADGLQDAGETPFSGVQVNLYQSDSTLYDSAVSDADGLYSFELMPPADYYLEFIRPNSYGWSPQDVGGDDALDSDPNRDTGLVAEFALGPSDEQDAWDAGLVAPGVSVDPIALELSEGGSTTTYDVVLNTQPQDNVQVFLNADAQVTANPSPLTFTVGNWNVPQQVSVTAIDDDVIEGEHVGVVSHVVTSFDDPAYNNLVIPSVTVNITDNDAANSSPEIVAAMNSVNIPEGQTATNDGVVSDPDDDPLTLSASIGNVTANNGVWTWSWSTSDGPAESQTVTITVDDGNGGSAQTSFELVVENIAPVATFSDDTGPITVGGAVMLSFSGQADPSSADRAAGYTYSYDCDNDGAFELDGSTDTVVMCSYFNSGVFTALGRIVDKDGGFNDYTVNVTVNDESNTLPNVDVDQIARNAGEGQTATNTGTLSDDDGDTLTVSASVGAVIDNGDGTWSWNWETSDGPAESQTVTINVSDSRGGTNQVSFELTVNNIAPIADFANTSGTIFAGDSATLQFSNQADPSSVDTTDGFRYSYDCTNDGAFDVENSLDASAACLYSNGGTFTVLGRIADKDGGYNDYTTTVIVDEPVVNNPPTIDVNLANVNIAEGQTVFNGGSMGDPDGDSLVLTASVGAIADNGDGTWSWSWSTNDGPDESQIVTLVADDGRGGHGEASFELGVINVAPTADFENTSGEVTVGEGASLVFSNQFDPSFADAITGFRYSYDCNNDGAYELGNSSQSSAICTYLEVGTFTAHGRITDKDGDYNDYMTTVTVTEVPPVEPLVEIDSFAFLAQEGVWFQAGSSLTSGNVGVNTTSDGPFLRNGSEISLDRGVTFQNPESLLMGDSIRLSSRVEVYDTYYNELNRPNSILGDAYTPLGFPLVAGSPAIPSFAAGDENLRATSGSLLTIHTGDYGTLSASRNSTIVFTGGVYNFQSWNLRSGVRVYFAAPTEIRIAGQLRVSRDTYIGPDPAALDVDAAHIVFYVMGQNGDDGAISSLPKAAQFGSNTTLIANMLVPNGTLRIHNDTQAIGAYLGRWIIVGRRTQTTILSAFGGPIDFSEYGVDPTETPQPTESPTATTTTTPSVTPSSTPSVTQSPTATESPTVVVSETPTPDPTESPTPDATESPTPEPTDPPIDYTIPAECIGIAFSGDPIFGTEQSDEITGTEGNDLIFGLGGHDGIYGLGGDDCIVGGRGADFIIAGFGNDVLFGGDDDDTLIGNEGEDRIFGEEGADNLFGGDDNDDLQGGDDSDEIFGGDGDDTIDGGEDSDAPLAGDGGNDTIHGGEGHDVLYGDEDIHNDANNHFDYDLIGEIGEPGDDMLYGDDGHDAVYGGDGNDWIDGGLDGDNLFGNAGNDTITGGSGSDEFRGGDGNDTVTDYADVDGRCRTVESGCGNDELPDDDNDGVDNASDACPGFDDNLDVDGDGTPDGCDTTPNGDDDNDGVDNASDVCPGFDDNQDTDGDGTPNGCDTTPNGDSDGDGVDNASDVCPGFDDHQDTDGDGTPNGCDNTPNGDDDNDSVDNASDVCPGFDDHQDTDGDGTPNGCDTTPNGDADGDGVDNLSDNCPDVANPNQVDSNGDGQGDACTIPS